MPRKLIPPGTPFTRLTVLRRGADRILANGRRVSTSDCLCECGTEVTVPNSYLRSRWTQSCGCLDRDVLIARSTKHGHSKRNAQSRIYLVWSAMLRRCRNENVREFPRYGGRGITYFQEWSRFESFLEFMGPGKKGWTIHRVDTDAGYFPENMVWATMKFQCRHKSNNHILTVRGITGCLSELCERFGVPRARTLYRIQKGWDAESAFFTPKMR
jgi:hypothetical protein